MKDIKDVVAYLIENRKDEDGDLDLTGMDFTGLCRDVYINMMVVPHSLAQNEQKVGGNLHQDYQKVGGDLLQDVQEVGGDLLQDVQEVGGDLLQDSRKVEGSMLLQSHEGLEQIDGDWFKKKTLSEKVAASSLDEDLKKAVLEALKGK